MSWGIIGLFSFPKFIVHVFMFFIFFIFLLRWISLIHLCFYFLHILFNSSIYEYGLNFRIDFKICCIKQDGVFFLSSLCKSFYLKMDTGHSHKLHKVHLSLR